jgi:hypothetical protein
MYTRLYSGSQNGREQLGDVNVVERAILKQSL